MNVAKFFGGALFGALISAATITAAAPGDLIYEHQAATVKITAQQAVCFADCAIAAGSWTGARADMTMACAERDGAGGFTSFARGYKTDPVASVPAGSTVVGYVQ